MTEDLTSYQIFKMKRISSSQVDVYREGVLERSITGLTLANDYQIYLSGDGYDSPNTLVIDYVKINEIQCNDNPYKLNSHGYLESEIDSAGNHTFYIFRVYGRALTSGEVRNNYNNERELFNV